MVSSIFSRLKYGFILLAGSLALSSCAKPDIDTGDTLEQTELQEDGVSTPPEPEESAALPAPSQITATKAPFELNNALLPFDMPARADLAASAYKVFAHWHNFPLRQFSTTAGVTTDNYTGWLKPTGQYASIGGWIRDRPIPILPIPPTEADYRKRDMKTDIQTAAAAGVDGFLFNFWFPPTDSRWAWLTSMFDAADEFNTENPAAPFYIIPNVDSHILSGGSGKDEPRTRADHVATFKSRASWMKLNGKYLIGSFRPEALPATWYVAFFDQLKTVHGIDAVLWGSLLEPTDANRTAMKPFMVGATFSRWDNLPYNANFSSGLSARRPGASRTGSPMPRPSATQTTGPPRGGRSRPRASRPSTTAGRRPSTRA